MSQFVETATRAFTAGAARAQHLRVKLSGTSLATAGASDVSIGTQLAASFAAADTVAVRLRTAQGTRKTIANAAIAAGDPVYAAAAGKVAPSGTIVEGMALEAAAADGNVIEIMDIPNTDVSATIAGTNAATFAVDADASTPKLAFSGQSGGTGDFTTTLKPEAALSANNAIIVPEANGDTLVAAALAQELTSKTLTAAVIKTGCTASGSAANDFSASTGTFKTSTGKNTLGGLAAFKTIATPVAAAGSSYSNAAALGSANLLTVSSDSAAKGVSLLSGVVGDRIRILNTSTTACILYPFAGGTLNGLAANAGVLIPASKGVDVEYTASDTSTVFDLPAHATAA